MKPLLLALALLVSPIVSHADVVPAETLQPVSSALSAAVPAETANTPAPVTPPPSLADWNAAATGTKTIGISPQSAPPEPVPEPSLPALLALGGIALYIASRRRSPR